MKASNIIFLTHEPGFMSLRQSRSTFELVPAFWFEPIVGLWVALLAGFGMGMTVYHGSSLLRPLGTATWAAVAVTVFATAVGYGVFGFGLTHLYRTYRGFEPGLGWQPLDSTARRWLGGLGGLAVVLMALRLVWVQGPVSVMLLGFDLPAYPDGMGGLTLGLSGVNELVNQAPLVIFAALLAGLLMGPAVGAVFHGILQDTVGDVAPPTVTVTGTAVATALIAGHSTITTTAFIVAFGFVLAVAYAYRETENLLLVMAAYGLFNAVALVLAWVDILARLAAAGHLFG